MMRGMSGGTGADSSKAEMEAWREGRHGWRPVERGDGLDIGLGHGWEKKERREGRGERKARQGRERRGRWVLVEMEEPRLGRSGPVARRQRHGRPARRRPTMP